MNPLVPYLLNIALFSAFPFYFGVLRERTRETSFYVYLGTILTLGGFLGAVYSIPITPSINVSGGNLAYGSFMMSAILLVMMANDPGAIRNVIKLVVIANVFVFLLFTLMGFVLGQESVRNPFGIVPAVFDTSIWVLLLGEVLIVGELLFFMVLAEFLKKRTSNQLILSILYIPLFVLMICLDGVLFPLIAFGIKPELIDIIVGGMGGKIVLASSYALVMAGFLAVYRRRLSGFFHAPMSLRALLFEPKGELVKEIGRQRESLALSDRKYQHLANSIDDIFFSVDSGMKVTYWNKACEKLGRKAADAVGRDLHGLLPAPLSDRLREFFDQAAKRGIPATIETSAAVAGIERWYDVAAYPFDGGISVLARDISERVAAEDAVKSSLRQKELLLQELYHRTKNNMQVISSILALQASELGDERISAAFAETEDRIEAMALVHQKLYQSSDLSSIDLKGYIIELSNKLVEGYGREDSRVACRFELEDVPVLIDVAIPCGLVINELLTNSLKYAFPDGRVGQIAVSLAKGEGETIELRVSDDGVGPPPGFDLERNAKVGLRTVVGIVEHQLGGTISFGSEKGFSCAMSFGNGYYGKRL